MIVSLARQRRYFDLPPPLCPKDDPKVPFEMQLVIYKAPSGKTCVMKHYQFQGMHDRDTTMPLIQGQA